MPKNEPPARRMGPPGSTVWHSMLDGAEEVLREEGYGAVTSRRVAERIGVQPRLIYYYFHTMEDLIVETFRRLAARDLERLAEAIDRNLSLAEIWALCIDTADTRLTSEFIALANRIEDLRTEVINYTRETRRMIAQALTNPTGSVGRATGIPPNAAAFLATSAAIALHREKALGLDLGHEEAISELERYMHALSQNGPHPAA